jgi:hypothetical protein
MNPVCVLPVNVIEIVLALIVPYILPVTANMQQAREAAWHMLGDYRVRSSEEFRLAGEIISFSLQALTALANAAEPGLPFQKICRYRAAAVSLKRSGSQAQRQLDALRRLPAAEDASETLGELPPYQPLPQLEPEATGAANPAAEAPQAEVQAQSAPAPDLAERANHLLEAARRAGNAGNHTHARQLAEDARRASLAQQIRDGARRRQAEHAQTSAATDSYFAAAAAQFGEADRAQT